MPERIVAVGLLTARDLDVLGTSFRRMFPVSSNTDFDDLLLAIDKAVERSGADRCSPELHEAAPAMKTR